MTSARTTSTRAMERVVAGLQQRRVVTEKEKRDPRLPRGRARADVAPDGRRCCPSQKVTIVSRGQALGYTLNLPTEDRYLHTKEELVDLMKVVLAGRAAEQVVFGRVTNGAANDLEQVTEIARAMVFEYGMSEVVAVADDARRQLRALRGDEAAARLRAGAPHRPRLRGGACGCSTKHRAVARPRRRGAAREGDARPRRARGAARATSRRSRASSETVGTVARSPACATEPARR